MNASKSNMANRYTPSFARRTVELVRAGRKPSQLPRESCFAGLPFTDAQLKVLTPASRSSRATKAGHRSRERARDAEHADDAASFVAQRRHRTLVQARRAVLVK